MSNEQPVWLTNKQSHDELCVKCCVNTTMSSAEAGGRLGGVLQFDQNLDLCMEIFSHLQPHNLLTLLRTSENKVMVTVSFYL